MSLVDEYDVYDDYGMTPDQLHAGLIKLWHALSLTTAQDTDVFTLAAERITSLEDEVHALNCSLVHGEF
jgi:hypothetical protein